MAPIVRISIEKASVEVKPELVCSMPVAPGQNRRWTSSKTWPLDVGWGKNKLERTNGDPTVSRSPYTRLGELAENAPS